MKFIEEILNKNEFYNHDCRVNYPLNAPDDPIMGLNRDEMYCSESILNTCLYRTTSLNTGNKMAYNRGFARAIARLVAPATIPSLTGYAGFGFDKSDNFYADYWDGTAEDFNSDINSGITDFSKGRHQLFKIDGRGKLYACVIDEDGKRSKLLLNTKGNRYSKDEKHSPSGLIYALAAFIVARIREEKLNEGEPGYEVGMVIYQHYTDLCDAINTSSVDRTADYLRCLDNDLYTLVRFDNEVKNRYDSLPFIPNLVDRNEYPLLTETEFEMESTIGHSAILSGSVQLNEEGGYMDEDDVPNRMTIAGIMANEANWKSRYVLSPERVLSEQEQALVPHLDSMVPAREVLTKAELIKASSSFPQKYRNLLWTGETGSGKSTSCQMLAQLHNLPYVFITFNPDTILSDLYVNILPATEGAKEELNALTASLPKAMDIALNPVDSYYQITGKMKSDATEEDCAKAIQDRYYELLNGSNGFIKVESPLVQAFRYGWLVELQEANVVSKPGVLSGINAAMDTLSTIQLPDGEIVKRHPDCIIVLTANVDYEGTRRLNQAVKSRCALKGKFELPDDGALIEMIRLDSSYDEEDVIRKMIQAMKAIRKVLNETGTTDGSCGVREVIAWAAATKILGDPYRAAMHTIIPSATDDDEVLAEIVGAFENFFIKKSAKTIAF